MSRTRARRDRGAPGLGGEQVEGYHAVRELLTARRRSVHELVIARARAPRAADIVRFARAAGARVRDVQPDELDELAVTDAPQGLVARASPIPSADLDALLDADRPFLVALDGVTDPGNLGAILRTAETAGVTGVVLGRSRAARLGPAALKAAAGAVEHVPLAVASGIPALVERAGRHRVWSVALAADGAVDVFDLEVADQALLVVLGSEGRGVGRLTRERCDVVAHITMHGRLDSLNVSAAAAIALHAIARRRAR